MKSGAKIFWGLIAAVGTAGGLAYYFLRPKAEAAPPGPTSAEIISVALRKAA